MEKEVDEFQEVDLANGSNSPCSSLDFAEFSAWSDVLLDSVGASIGSMGALIGSTGAPTGIVAVLKDASVAKGSLMSKPDVSPAIIDKVSLSAIVSG